MGVHWPQNLSPQSDFHIEVETRRSGDAYRLGAFKAFIGQDEHLEAFLHPAKISWRVNVTPGSRSATR
ncbi:MAG: hypothetical protein ACRDNZ_17650 [Streptosporangiaceae bacterium]